MFFGDKDTAEIRTSLVRLYRTFNVCLARVTVELPDSRTSTGTAFHIGNGYLATARHVVEENKIVEIVPLYRGMVNCTVEHAPIYHENPNVDLAILKTDFSLSDYMKPEVAVPFEKKDHIPIGHHVDEWLNDEFMLSKAMVIGYPPIPRSSDAFVVAVETEVSAIVNLYMNAPYPHFILSMAPRGGFSGGPAFSEHGALLGVVTQELFQQENPPKDGQEKRPELGFTAVLSTEPLLQMIHTHGIACGENLEIAKELFRRKQGDHGQVLARSTHRRGRVAYPRSASQRGPNPLFRP